MVKTRKKEQDKTNKSNSKNLIWAVLSILVGGLSIYAVLSQSKEISLVDIGKNLVTMHKGWLIIGIICMLGFIYFEACAIRETCHILNSKCKVSDSVVYSAADIYFSAITPSATGGQPASGCAMVQDGISAMKTTAALIMNLSMYTISLIIIGTVCLLTKPKLFLCFGNVSRLLIIVGFIVQFVLVSFFLLLVKNEKTLSLFGNKGINLLKKIHIIKDKIKIQRKFDDWMNQYKSCAEMFSNKRNQLWKVLLYNVLQRSSQIAVTMCVYMALGGGMLAAYDLWVIQSFVLIGSNFVPIPGGMGVTDYLMLNGFSSFLAMDAAVNLEMISRSLSFYVCIILCGLILIGRFVTRRYSNRKENITC